MKAFSAGVAALALAAGLAATLSFNNRGVVLASEAGNAAYRDGTYLGRLTAMSGNAPHIAVGRWSTDADRNSYSTGYEKAYAQTLDTNNQAAHDTNAAFRDGKFLGSLAAARGEEVHIAAGRWATENDRTLFTEGYERAYSDSAVQTARNSHFRASE
jgi:hypothetical protein